MASMTMVQAIRSANKIDLEQVPVFMQASSAALPMTAFLMALVRRQGKSTKKLRGCIGMDSLQTLVSVGEFPRSLKGAYDRMAHLTIWAKKYAPQMHTVNVHSQPYHNGGGNAVQEVAFVLATAAEYLRQLLNRGLVIEDIAPRICFSFCVGANFFMEVAKLRAARLLWAKIVAACGGDENAHWPTPGSSGRAISSTRPGRTSGRDGPGRRCRRRARRSSSVSERSAPRTWRWPWPCTRSRAGSRMAAIPPPRGPWRSGRSGSASRPSVPTTPWSPRA